MYHVQYELTVGLLWDRSTCAGKGVRLVTAQVELGYTSGAALRKPIRQVRTLCR